MSHIATTWLASVTPDEMTHGEFRVLFHLCDCHNPSAGCFPKQTYLRTHTGLSNGGLNKALGELERKGLLTREKTRDPATKRQLPTRYILGFEDKGAQDPAPLSGGGTNVDTDPKPSPLSGAGAVSTSDAKPSPLSRGSVSTGVESYTNDKPVKEPVREPCAEAHKQEMPSSFVDGFLAVYPRTGNVEATAEALREAIEGGADPEAIMAGARAYAAEQQGNDKRYIAYSENWIAKERWTEIAPAPKPADPEAIAQTRAKAIRNGQTWVGRHISPHAARELVSRGLVTAEECKAAGVQL